MKICKGCGAQIGDSDRFCQYCGTKQDENIHHTQTTYGTAGFDSNSATYGNVGFNSNSTTYGNAGFSNNQNTVSSNQNTYGNAFTDPNERNTEVAFWIGLVSLIMTIITGISLGLIPAIVVICLGIKGLQTQKRGKAIAAITMGAIIVGIVVMYIMSAISKM